MTHTSAKRLIVAGIAGWLLVSLITCNCRGSASGDTETADTTYRQVSGGTGAHTPKPQKEAAGPVLIAPERPAASASSGSAAHSFTPYSPEELRTLFAHRPALTDTGKRDTIYLTRPIDTVALLRDYLARRAYDSTYNITGTDGRSFGTVRLRDTVQLNAITGRRLDWNFHIPEIHHRPAPKRWGIGGQAGYGLPLRSGQLQPYLGVGLSYNLIRFNL